MTALIIDDEIQIRRLLRLALESRDYVVREAETGRLGLQEAAFHRPDLVLLDLALPDMDGLDVLKSLREWRAVQELIARLAVIQRRHVGKESPEGVVRPLTMHLDRHEVVLSGEPLRMSPTEYAFLHALARHAGKIVTQRQLLREVRGTQGDGQTHHLRVDANRLRKKLDDKLVIRKKTGIGDRLLDPACAGRGNF